MSLTLELQAIRHKQQQELELADLIHGFKDIREQMALGTAGYTPDHCLDHLKTALQGAVTLEFATLPPYLSAIWSIKDDCDRNVPEAVRAVRTAVAQSIREIMQEEMLHMALVCNLLVAIGGCPQINTALPTYPGKLPLNVHPELTVGLAGLNQETLRTFLEIERPLHIGHQLSLKTAAELRAESLAGHSQAELTIGELYDEIIEGLKLVHPTFHCDHQITGPLSWMIIKNRDDAERAIRIIQRQGEGSDGPPDTGADDLAHYYRFAEIYENKKLTLNPQTQRYAFTTPLGFDLTRDVWPMAPVPPGGYTDAQVSDPDVRRLLRSFNRVYSQLIDLLQAVWSTDGGQAAFWHGIETMFELEKYAKPLMQIPRPDGQGNYGPDFRYSPPADR